MNIDNLQILANKLRFSVIKNSHDSKTPHLGSCLSCLDLLVALYWEVLKIDENNFKDKKRDRFILSKGHAAPALYHVLAEKKFFSKKLLETYGTDGSLLGEHPVAPGVVNGIEAATGSLGHGLPLGVGMAVASRMSKENFKIFVLMSDGECNEGSVWEAAMFAASQQLKNITVIIDYNKWQATGRSDQILHLAPLSDKWESFGWDVSEINGHSFTEILSSLKPNKQPIKKPKIVIANTIKGKGVSFMEDDNNWHYRIPSEVELEKARIELGISKISG